MRTAVERLGFAAGIATLIAIAVPAFLGMANAGAGAWSEPRWLLFTVSFLTFTALFTGLSGGCRFQAVDRFPGWLLLLEVLSATGAYLALPQYGLIAILYIITASHAAHLLSLRAGLLLVTGQSLVIATVSLLSYDAPQLALVQTLAYFGFQLFALMTTHATVSESSARRKLARANAELRATQALLAESSRLAERLRIARELHDLIGHHLTALSLNLEVAGHLTEGKAAEQVAKAHAIAKLLLADVRDVVSTIRRDDSIDVEQVVRELVTDLPRPRVHLHLPPTLRIDDPAKAHVLVRCMQEIITNTVRHANADNLWLEFERGPDGINVRAYDDGRGAAAVRQGNGLTGMRERLEQLGGSLQVDSAPGRGFRIEAFVPEAFAAAG